MTTDHMGSTYAHHYPRSKFHQCSPYRTSGYLTFFVISQSEQICKWGIKYTKFHQCSPYRTLDIWLFLLSANQNRYANEVLNMHILWRQTTWVVLVFPTTHIPSLTKISHCILIWEPRFTFWCWRALTSVHIYTYLHQYRQCYNWKLSGLSSIAGGPQKKVQGSITV